MKPTIALPRLRHLCRPLLPVLLLLLVLLSAVSGVRDQISATSRQLNGLNGQIFSAQTQLGRLVLQDQALKTQINHLNAQIDEVNAQMQQETARLQQLAAQVAAIQADLAAKERVLQQHIDAFSAQMRLMYKSGQVSPLELVLSAANFNDLLNRIFFFNDIMRDDQRQVDELRKERAVIEDLKTQVEAKQAQQAQVVASIKAQQAQLVANRAQIAGLQQQVAALEAQLHQELADMQAQRAALRQQLLQLVQQARAAGATGIFAWPMSGVITQGFGCTTLIFEPYDPSCATEHFHSGIDIANTWGTPVAASDGGIVHNLNMFCGGALCGYGNYVVIVHGSGYDTLYGHLSSFGVADGSPVYQGEVIGYEGSTGNSTGPHLHFEIDLNGSPVNPLNYLP